MLSGLTKKRQKDCSNYSGVININPSKKSKFKKSINSIIKYSEILTEITIALIMIPFFLIYILFKISKRLIWDYRSVPLKDRWGLLSDEIMWGSLFDDNSFHIMG